MRQGGSSKHHDHILPHRQGPSHKDGFATQLFTHGRNPVLRPGDPFSQISGSRFGCQAEGANSVPNLWNQVGRQQAGLQGMLWYGAQLPFKPKPSPPTAVGSEGCWRLRAEPSPGVALVPGCALVLGAACSRWPVNAGGKRGTNGIIPLSQVRLL